MKSWRLSGMVAALGLLAGVAVAEPAAAPERPLADAAQEARAKQMFGDIRCVVCQHESIADSPAGIAADMRALVREQIAEGRTDQEVRDDLVRRYGDFVLFTPPVRAGTWLLWFGPFALVVLAGLGFVLIARRRRQEEVPLSEAEEAALAELMADKTEKVSPPK